MNLNLHKNARTTAAIRQELRESAQLLRALALGYNLSRATVRKWRQRDSVHDGPHHLQEDAAGIETPLRTLSGTPEKEKAA